MTVLLGAGGHLMQDELAKQVSSPWSHSFTSCHLFASRQLPAQRGKAPGPVQSRQPFPRRCFRRRCSIRHVSTSCAQGWRFPKGESELGRWASTSTLPLNRSLQTTHLPFAEKTGNLCHRGPPLPTPRPDRGEAPRDALHPPRDGGFPQAGETAALEII